MDAEHAENRSLDDQQDPETPDTTPRGPVVKPLYVFISALGLMVPSSIPFYFALTTEIPRARPVLIIMGVGVVLLNAMMLILIVRWLNRWAGVDTSEE